MKHLKKFNENADETLEPQDLLDITQDLLDDGYTVKYITVLLPNKSKSPYVELLPSDIISNNEKCSSFDIYYQDNFRIKISDFPMEDLQKVLDSMEVAKKRFDEYDFVLDNFGVNSGVSDMHRKPIIESVLFSFVWS